jgi:tetratricopeptide (TPR) repeat protein
MPSAPQRKLNAIGRKRAARRLPRRPLLLIGLLGTTTLLSYAAWRHHDRGHIANPARTATAPAWARPDDPEAGRLLQTALARPADAGAQIALGRQYQSSGRTFEALWAFERAHAAGDRSAETDLALAEALEAGHLPIRALDLLAEAAAGQPGDAAIAERRAALQLRLGRPDAALLTLRSLDPAALNVSMLRGQALEALGDDDAAVAQYRRCAAAEPSSAAARLRLGRLLIRRGATADGRTALQAAHQLAPADPRPCYALGMSYWSEIERNPDRAGTWFTRAVGADPEYRPAYVALGRMYARHHLWKPAAEEFARALQSDAKDADALMGLAQVLEMTGHAAEGHERRGGAYVSQGKLPQALAEYRAEAALLPGSREASTLISQVLIQMQRNADAANEIKSAAARNPRDGALQERLAELYVLSHTRDPARRVCEAWLRVDPRAARAYWLRGRISSGDLQAPAAIDDFERALRLAPDDPELLYALGEALSRSTPRRDPARSLSLLERAVELAPREPRYRYQLGFLLQQMGRPEPAQRQFLRALDGDPTMTAAYTGLIEVAGRLREPGQIALFAPVVRDLQAAKRVEPGLRRRVYSAAADPTATAALARYLAGRGDLGEARAQWQVAAALRPDDPEARRELARLNRILDAL